MPLAAACAQLCGVHFEDVWADTREKAFAARARQIAMYLMVTSLETTYSATGDAFARDRTSVRYACSVIEDCRDDPQFDAALIELEGVLAAALARPQECIDTRLRSGLMLPFATRNGHPHGRP